MKVILGIGNPGEKYHNTKHNIGFMILDRFAEKHKISFSPSKNEYFYTKGALGSFRFLLAKPTTYVNLTGVAAIDILNEYSVETKDFLILTDDLNLSLGKLRIRQAGGDGGHNGIKSLIYHIEDDQFPRIRFGIGNEFDDGEMAEYVLSKFSEKEFDIINPKIDFCVELIEQFIMGGLQSMLNHFSKNSNQLTNNKSEGLK